MCVWGGGGGGVGGGVCVDGKEVDVKLKKKSFKFKKKAQNYTTAKENYQVIVDTTPQQFLQPVYFLMTLGIEAEMVTPLWVPVQKQEGWRGGGGGG